MVQKQLEVALHEDGVPHITYEPWTEVDFRPIDIVIPSLRANGSTQSDIQNPNLAAERPIDEASFRKRVELKVQERCGVSACKGTIRLAVSSMLGEPALRIVTGVTLDCPSQECPLIDPPSSGDREPRMPTPHPPTLEAQADLPLPTL